MPGSVILAGARTPIGKLSGALAGFSAMDLGGFAIAAALERAGVSPADVDYVFMGQVLQAGQGQITARQAATKGGIPMSVPSTTVNKVCLSGLNSIYLADMLIAAGEADVVVAGGMESMTQAPYLLPGARAGYRAGDGTLVDSMMYDGLYCQFDHCAMGLGTEQYNREAKISRAAQDSVRGDVARARRHRHQGRPFRRRDRGRVGAAAQGRSHRRGHRRGRASGHHGGVARRPEARLRQGGDHHRRECQPDIRRRRGGGRDVAGPGRGPGGDPSGGGGELRAGRRPRRLAPAATGQRHREGSGQGGQVTRRTSLCSRSTRRSRSWAWLR